MNARALAGLLVAAWALLTPGCGPETPKFDPTTRYSPESLAQELAFRYKALGPRPAASKAVKSKVPRPRTEEASKGAEASKAAPAETLDDLVAETARKARAIPGLTAAEARKQVADALAKDASIAEADRQKMVEGLTHPADPS